MQRGGAGVQGVDSESGNALPVRSVRRQEMVTGSLFRASSSDSCEILPNPLMENDLRE